MATLIWASVEAMQLETGLQGKSSNMPVCVKCLVMDSWIKSLWLACPKFEIQIQSNLPPWLSKHKQHLELACLFLQYGYQAKDLHILN